jgi:hypothetical protein
MTTGGIRRTDFDNGPQYQVGTRVLLPEEVKKLDAIRKSILEKLIPYLDSEGKYYIDMIDASDIDPKQKTFSAFWSFGKDKKSKRVYLKVKPYSVFHYPSKKSKNGTIPVPHKKITETDTRRFDIEQRCIQLIKYIYIGAKVKSIVTELEQTIIKSINEKGTINAQTDEAAEWANDADESILDNLVEMDAAEDHDKKESDGSDGSDSEEAPPKKGGKKPAAIPKDFKSLMEDDDVGDSASSSTQKKMKKTIKKLEEDDE